MAAKKSAREPNRQCGDLAGLDAMELESLALFVFKDIRPLKGVAGFVDWRLCGTVSRMILDGHFEGKLGEHVLMPVTGTLNVKRLFIFGLGPVAKFSQAGLSGVCGTAVEVMTRAGVGAIHLAQPSVHARQDVAEDFLQVTSRTIRRHLASVVVSPEYAEQ